MEKKPFVPFLRDVSLDQPIRFGKHRGKTIKKIIECDTSWINWAIENLKMHLDGWAFEYLLEMEKPLLNDQHLRIFCARIEKGEVGLVDKIKDHYRLTEWQTTLLNAYIQLKEFRK